MKNYITKLNILAWASLFSLAYVHIEASILDWMPKFNVDVDFKPIVKNGADCIDTLHNHFKFFIISYCELERVPENADEQTKAAIESSNLEKMKRKFKSLDLQKKWQEDVKPLLNKFASLEIKEKWQEDVKLTLWWIKVAAICIALTTLVRAAYELFIAKDNKDVRKGIDFLHKKYKGSSKKKKSRRAPLQKAKRRKQARGSQ